MDIEIPPVLADQTRQGRVILFLGAGASRDARDSKGASPPTGQGLAERLSDKFLGGQFHDADLSTVAALAISELGLLAVQKYISDLFDDFAPTEGHRLLPKFIWGGLATTNYDTLVEKAYRSDSSCLQNPVPFVENGDQVIELMRDQKAVKYLKLHGCITRASNENCALILTKDQYITYRKGRSRLFDQLHEWAYEHTIVFVGHAVQDPNIREVIFELDQQVASRPRYFLVAPDLTDIEKRFWETKKVTVLDTSFRAFLQLLDSEVSSEFRGLAVISTTSSGISKHFRIHGALLSKNCNQFLEGDATYVESCVATKNVDPKDFYKGYNADWSPVEQGLDVRRYFADEILEDVFLRDDLQATTPLEFVLIKGYAGSGKSVSLRRIAWDAARDYNCISGTGRKPNVG